MKIEEALKSKKITNPNEKLYLNIVFTSIWLEEKTNKIFKVHNITSHQYNVLRILRGNQGNSLPAFEIQERMITKNSNVTRIIEKLIAKKLVNKGFDKTNRRKIAVSISEAGLELLQALDHIICAEYQKLFKNISDSEASIISDFLDQIRAK